MIVSVHREIEGWRFRLQTNKKCNGVESFFVYGSAHRAREAGEEMVEKLRKALK